MLIFNANINNKFKTDWNIVIIFLCVSYFIRKFSKDWILLDDNLNTPRCTRSIPEEKGCITVLIFWTFRNIISYKQHELQHAQTKSQNPPQNFHLYAEKKLQMHYRLWVLYGKKEKLVLSFNIKKRYHCGFARNITLSLKSMMQRWSMMNVNPMICLRTQAENFLHDIIYDIKVLDILIKPERKLILESFFLYL